MSVSLRETCRRWLWLALGLLALFGLTAAWSRRGLRAGAQERTTERATEGHAIASSAANGAGERARGSLAIPVRVDTVQRGDLHLRVSATGQAEASARVRVAARVAGWISDVPVRVNDRVGRGQIVVRLDPGEHLLAIRHAEAGLEEAEARYREMTLFDDRIEDPAVREERVKAGRARSGLDRAEVEVRRARLDLAATAITAPFSGRVANVLVERGLVVGVGEELLTIVDLTPILVEAQVVESELRWLREGGGAEIRLPALPDTAFRGQIRSISPVVDPQTRTARVTVVLANPEGRILPGMFARVSLEGRSFEDRVLVPEEAIVERDDRTLVFLFEPIPDGPSGEGLARWVYVTAGLSNDGYIELVDGEGTEVPRPGALVVTGGNYTLIHGARVRVTTGAADREGAP